MKCEHSFAVVPNDTDTGVHLTCVQCGTVRRDWGIYRTFVQGPWAEPEALKVQFDPRPLGEDELGLDPQPGP